MPKLKRAERTALLDSMRYFLPAAQALAIREIMRGGELDQSLLDLATVIKTMPETGGQDGKGLDAIAHLHYFSGACDYYISEKDVGWVEDDSPGEQRQAFGLACISYGELGYIDLWSLLRHPSVEVDLHWTPKTLRECMAENAKRRGI